MKKLLIVSAVCTMLVGCRKTIKDANVDDAWTFHGNDCTTKVVTIENHKYVIMDGWYSGGIVHAASCECMNK